MQADIDGLLAELEELSEREGGMWNVGPEGGAFLAWMIRLTGATRVLEVGTSNGYSAIWMGRALRQVSADGALVTLEIEPRKIAMAHANIRRAGLQRTVMIVEGPGVASLQALGGAFDLVFIDADKPQYVDYLREIRRLIHPGSVIVADNMTTHPDETGPYRAAVAAGETLDSVAVPVGGGFLLSRVIEPPVTE
jgi:predicted O-methyltransferase YrrM